MTIEEHSLLPLKSFCKLVDRYRANVLPVRKVFPEHFVRYAKVPYKGRCKRCLGVFKCERRFRVNYLEEPPGCVWIERGERNIVVVRTGLTILLLLLYCSARLGRDRSWAIFSRQHLFSGKKNTSDFSSFLLGVCVCVCFYYYFYFQAFSLAWNTYRRSYRRSSRTEIIHVCPLKCMGRKKTKTKR